MYLSIHLAPIYLSKVTVYLSISMFKGLAISQFLTDRQTDRQKERKKERKTDRQTDRQTCRYTDIQIDHIIANLP